MEPWEQDIIDLNARLDYLAIKIADLNTSIDNSNKSIGKGNNLLVEAGAAMKGIVVNSAKFATNMQAQYVYAEKLAESSKSTAREIGLAVGRSGEFTKTFNRAAAQVAKFGGEASDVANIITRMADNSGRARIISEEEVLNVFLLEKGLGVAKETAADMMERMDSMGMNAVEANKAIESMVVDSQKLGLNSSKVAKVLANNFKQMSNMSFRGGVKGMTEMAKLAVQMRMDVSEMLGMADKFYEPEQAIEAVANLQMLGGDVAEAFGDPFEIMYLARNKPEELAKRVQDMTENMMQFNSETGEYEFPAEARMQLKAAGEQLGINTDSMIEISRQASKIKDIKMNVSGNITDPDVREGIAGMARMNDKKEWVVDFNGEELGIEEIGEDMAEKILEAPKTEKDAIMDMAKNSMTTNEILTNIDKAIQTGYVAESNVYELLEDVLKPSIEGMFDGVGETVKEMLVMVKKTPVGDYQNQVREQSKKLGMDSGDFIDETMAQLPSKIFEYMPTKEEWKEYFNTSFTKDFTNTGGGSTVDVVPGQIHDGSIPKKEDMASMGGGNRILSGGFGDFSLDNRDLVIAGKPQNLLGGSGGGDTIKVEPITMTINGDLTLNAPNGSTNIDLDMESIKGVVTKMITDSLNGANYSGGKVGSSLNTA
jgi:hypothetical protein